MNLANKLTILRIILVPIFLFFIIAKGIPYGTLIATIIFILASITDKLDGYIARSRNQITNFGKFMDPLADKLLVISALICFVELKVVPSYYVIIIIAREFAVSGLRTIAASEGKVIAASWWGKIKTVIQMTAIITALVNLIINNNIIDILTQILFVIAVIITIVSGVDYFVKNKNIIHTNN
ncbi:CDP-diacylglycerol--glycerol-3-phosphate 3-phosphatidyltransferase [Clostridium tepidiprofundi DSM 19306]|uniref:CDP-diacylglycerol--glycerol-3-phosphate 3-phosphatidyltransferase n=1 Tax=Clostridium tepidiprofundi DSM 19306 TaxID=1121338 RepID=A0A151B7A8_9CLOT|nr:CDP-diacylglycerol--glycerol-3-phosphate 3-phosphatidyltransferase [Clostridium tepidiprofundi]KYH35779.1 CDP-diacylglycerol--glycerol-3-phosphate 3-phosphatidyltransferase [Clostridium tepidiprofundi DSM 19306]